MTGKGIALNLALVIASLVVGAVGGSAVTHRVTNRYYMQASSISTGHGSTMGVVYRIDRRTGQMWKTLGGQLFEVKQKPGLD